MTYGFSQGYPIRGGFPHSDMPGSKIAPISPGLFAGCHVLHRLLPPRHPPDALLLLHQSLQKQTQPKMGSLPFPRSNPPRQRTRSGAIRFQTLSERQPNRIVISALSSQCQTAPALSRNPQQGSRIFQNAIQLNVGGGERDRTDDLKLAKLALSQLSYAPLRPRLRGAGPLPRAQATTRHSASAARAKKSLVGLGRLELPTSRLSGVRSNHLSYRPSRKSDRTLTSRPRVLE